MLQIMIVALFYALDRPFELAAREHHTPIAPQAAHANIRTNAIDAPAVAATGMNLARQHNIANPKLF